jgi:uncharacterized membrane protein (DUF106 family)
MGNALRPTIDEATKLQKMLEETDSAKRRRKAKRARDYEDQHKLRDADQNLMDSINSLADTVGCIIMWDKIY